MRTYFSRVRLRALFPLFSLALLLVLGGMTAVRAQDDTSGDDADLGEAAQSIREIRALPAPKTLLFVFDVSGSMKSGGNLQRAREATVTILREATRPGDRVALFTFGAGTKKVFDKTIESGEDKADLISQVPTQTGDGAGTNIRRPHHESLKIADGVLPRDSAVILLTDSFNDEPKSSDEAYGDYLKYYTPGGQLTKYPNSPENRDYERLLAKLKRSGKLHQFGIGIGLDTNGRPIERLPQAAPPVPESTPTAPVTTNAPPPSAGGPSPLVWAILGGVALVLLVGGALAAPNFQTSVFRIAGGPGGAKDFRIKSGQTVRLGGDGASAAWDAYPLPGASAPVAHIKAARGKLTIAPSALPSAALTPAVAPATAAPRNQSEAARVYHNGLALESETPLDFGDEVRVALPSQASTGGGLAREIRLKFTDPKQI